MRGNPGIFCAIVCAASCALVPACATIAKPPTKAETAGARLPDTAVEKTAALRANDPHAHSDDEARRWGIEENKQRKQERKPAKKAEPAKPVTTVVGAQPQASPPPPAPPPPAPRP